MEITEKEFAVIREISNNHLPDQRTIATKVGISLGLTNLIIKQLINKGYVKAKQLTTRKIQYILTPQGFSEKTKKSYNYTVRTVNVINQARLKVKELLLNSVNKGAVKLVVSSKNEMLDMIELASVNVSALTLVKEDKVEDIPALKFYSADGKEIESVNIIEFLSEAGVYLTNN